MHQQKVHIDTAFLGQNSRRGRVGNQVAHTLTTSQTQAYYFIDMHPDPKVTEIARCITAVSYTHLDVYKRQPWHREPMKDVINCEKLRGAVSERYIRRFPNGAIRLEESLIIIY